MWRTILDWSLEFISRIEDYVKFLFTPINLNVATEGSANLLREMNDMGLSNFPTWIYDLLDSASAPLMVTPIQVLGVSTLVVICIWSLVKILA